MVDFSKLKGANNLGKLQKTLEDQAKGSFERDSTEWMCTLDKAGNGSATFRFLPGAFVDGEDALPWVHLFRHAFQGPGGWYIENSLATLKQKDPCQEMSGKFWTQGNKKQARLQKRKLTYISNIYMINDPGNPDNDGKVFKYRYGVKIFNKIRYRMGYDEEGNLMENRDLTDPDEAIFDPFDLFTGANFKLKVKKIETDGQKFPSYEDSRFMAPSALLGGDEEKLEAIWRSEYSLAAIVAPDQFKSYEDLSKRLQQVLSRAGDSLPKRAETAKVTPKEPESKTDDETLPWVDSEQDENPMDYFKKLAEG